ncbi:hypothetical protein AbraIFM66951_005991 [Aspergillus brasiliensis]|uniref:glutathione transferase n=1 Tax=Aspergillus brasiliensis TaxID=319629 RepID=A0A9W5Z4K0_9EURO|nr:hypothetical protein AbraCBS73388_004807 [Aspergillus brasiliensis]GKZ51535.1 hypothetical protein AbraIFM66951_005991 [Aspergillus brasiliensis]
MFMEPVLKLWEMNGARYGGEDGAPRSRDAADFRDAVKRGAEQSRQRKGKPPRVLIVLEELGIDYELISINMRAGVQKSPWYLSEHHTFGVIPAYQDTDTKIFESRAICQYLTVKHGGHLTPPSDPVQVAGFYQAASVEYSYFDPPFKQLAYESLFKRFVESEFTWHNRPNSEWVV